MKVIVDDLLNDVVFVDLTKAFDTINREIILRKMSYLGVDLQESLFSYRCTKTCVAVYIERSCNSNS